MNTWLFQGVPERYDVSEKLVEGKLETWLVTRFREDIKPGDIVYFYRAGQKEKRGIYGWGVIQGEPVYFQDWGWGISVLYKKKFSPCLSASELASDPVLSQHLIFRMPVGTNFRVSDEEASALDTLIRQKFSSAYSPREG